MTDKHQFKFRREIRGIGGWSDDHVNSDPQGNSFYLGTRN